MTRVYGRYKTSEDKTRCIVEVQTDFCFYQCQRKRTHGEYCGLHDPKRLEKIAKQKQIEYDKKWAVIHEKNKRYELTQKLCGHIPTNKLHKYKLVRKKKNETKNKS